MATVVQHCEGVLAAPVDGDVVLLRPGEEHYVALDDVGRRVWELAERPRPLAELLATLRAEFDDPEGRIEGDVLAFVRELCDEGLLVQGTDG